MYKIMNIGGVDVHFVTKPIYKKEGILWCTILCLICKEPKEARWTNVQKGMSLKHRSCSAKMVGMVYSKRAARFAEENKDHVISLIVNLVYKRMYFNKSKVNKERKVELTKEDVANIVFKNCVYCGAAPNQIFGIHKSTKFHGIDRVNSNLGYVHGNCVPCCKKCNKAKMDLSYEEFMDLIKRIYLHNKEELEKVA